MRTDRAWVRLSSGQRLDLLDLRPDAWSDQDLATGLARTYRWGGHSSWSLPLSVAQHSLSVLAIRQMLEGVELSPAVALRELLHDADEGLLGFDCITPLKPHLGEAYQRLTGLLQRTIAERYHLPAWDQENYLMHKRADRLAAISEARHVAAWSLDEIMEEFGSIGVLTVDPLQGPGPLPPVWQPWEPWPPDFAARMFLDRLRGLSNTAKRGRTLSELATAFANAPPAIRRRCKTSVHGDPARDHLIRAEAPDGEAWEGVIVAGEIEQDGAWVLDTKFLIFTTDERPEGQLITVFGWECDVQSI